MIAVQVRPTPFRPSINIERMCGNPSTDEWRVIRPDRDFDGMATTRQDELPDASTEVTGFVGLTLLGQTVAGVEAE